MDFSGGGGDGGDKNKAASLPEEWLNIGNLCMAFVYKVMNVLGSLATIWATVVLLGGFSTLIKQQDFWYVTVIAFVQSIGILGGYEDRAHQIFLRAPVEDAKWDQERSWWRRRSNPQPQQQQPARQGTRRASARRQEGWHEMLKEGWRWRTFLGMAISVAFRLGQVAALGTCVALSVGRLKKQDYVDPQYIDHDDHRNIQHSLNIFYGLVLAQGIIFTCLLIDPLLLYFTLKTRQKYKLLYPSGMSIAFRYKNNNYLEFITGNVRATLNTDLITFAKNLVVSGGSVADQLVGVRAMDRILRSEEYRSLALMRLRASLDAGAVGKLVDMLGLVSATDEKNIRGHAARVMLRLAPELLVKSFPQVLYLISSSLLNTSNNRMSNMDVDLVWFGLRILDKLTDNPENCKRVKDGDLLSKIVELTNLCGHGRICSNTISDSWIEQEIIPLLQKEDDMPTPAIQKIDQQIIVGMSLNILSKLVATPGAAGVDLRRKISEHFHFLTNTGMILQHVEATRVISCLAIDARVRKEIGMLPEVIKKLKDCLLSKPPHHVNITKVAAKLLLLEYSTSDQLDKIHSCIEETHNLEDQSCSLPVSAFVEELDLKQLLLPWRQQHMVQELDLEDLLSAPRVNHSEAAAKALILLTTGCKNNAAAFLKEINNEKQELEEIVSMLSSEGEEKENRRKLAHLQGRNVNPENLRILKNIFCGGGEEHKRSMVAKLLQNLRAYSGPDNFHNYMQVIDNALPQVFKAIVDEVATIEDPSSTNENLAHVKDDLWIKEGKLLESFMGLAVEICKSLTASDFANKLADAKLTAGIFIQKLKKILELFEYPTTDFPSIRRSTLELMTWMAKNSSSYTEILLQYGVYDQLREVEKTARKLESTKLIHCGVEVLSEPAVEVPGEHGISCISSLARELREQLHLCPNFAERSCRYREHASTISILIA